MPMSALASRAVSGGFRSPVFDSQAVFRALMNAVAEPGTTADLHGRVEPPAGLNSAAAAILAALSDPDAPTFLDEPSADATSWLAFQTGASPVCDPHDAAFAVLSTGSDPSGWNRFPLGTEPYPDRSATLILPVAALDGGARLVLCGPGIAATREIAPIGLPPEFVEYRSANAALFPRGHDVLLVAGATVLALPRTTRIERA